MVKVGLCGFTMSMKTYPKHFPVVEVQSTFYEPPTDAVLEKWRDTTGPALEYTVKVWQLVTHASNSPTYRRMMRPLAAGAEPGFFRNSAAVDEGWRRSVECARVLSATALLFQCPASFGPDPANIRNLREFLGRIERPPIRLMWEPRGARWVAERELAMSLCRELDLIYVVDPFVTQPATDVDVYWRLHGITGSRHSYSDDELFALRRMLVDARPRGDPYVMFNNLPRVGDAKRFAALVGDRVGGVHRAPGRAL